jgi:hypothetical protein
VVVENATYHSKEDKKEPSSNSLKFSIEYLLRNNNIYYDSDKTKIKISRCSKENSSKLAYSTDTRLKYNEFSHVRESPYHPGINTMEVI